MNSITKIFFILAILFALGTISVHAGADITFEPTNCLIGHLELYSANNITANIVGPINATYTDIDYYTTTTISFDSGIAYFNATVQNHRTTEIRYSVNGGAAVSAYYPANYGLYELSGLMPIGASCSAVTNIINLDIIQLDPWNYGRGRNCSYQYIYHITSQPSTVCGDPQFVGLRGQSFQVHGIDGAVYNLISAKEYSVSSRFQFLNGPRLCPIMPSTGLKSVACWTHEGSYLSNLGIVTSSGEEIAFESGSGGSGFSAITVNSRPIEVGEGIQFSQGFLYYNSTHEASIQIDIFHLEVENIDGFVNLRRVRVYRDDWAHLTKDGGVHGLLGQTWRNKRYSGKIAEIEGNPDDYVVDSLFSYEFPYSRMVIKPE